MLNDNGDVAHRLLWGPMVDLLLADENVSGDVLWALTDNQNTVRNYAEYDALLDETSIVNHIAYNAVGQVMSETNGALDVFGVRYTGKYVDPLTGLQYSINRWYDPVMARWISQDPIGFAAGDENLYRYVKNQVVSYIDPSGLEWVWPWDPRASWKPSDTGKLWANGAISTVAHTGTPGGWLDRNFSGGQYGDRDTSGYVISYGAEVGSIAPVAGEIADWGQVISGKDLEGNPLTPGERALTAGGAILPFVPASAARRTGKAIGEAGSYLSKVFCKADNVDEVTDLGKKIVCPVTPTPLKNRMGDAEEAARKARTDSVYGKPEVPADGIDIPLKRPEGVSDADWQKKMDALNKGAAEGRAKVVHKPVRDGKAQREARKSGKIETGHDADHGLDLQFGGEDTIDEIISTESRVNRSVGAQGRGRLQHPDGTPIRRFFEE